MNNAYSGILTDMNALTMGAVTPAAVASRIDRVIFAQSMASADLSAIQSYLGPANPSSTRVREAVGLALASPSFQWY